MRFSVIDRCIYLIREAPKSALRSWTIRANGACSLDGRPIFIQFQLLAQIPRVCHSTYARPIPTEAWENLAQNREEKPRRQKWRSRVLSHISDTWLFSPTIIIGDVCGQCVTRRATGSFARHQSLRRFSLPWIFSEHFELFRKVGEISRTMWEFFGWDLLAMKYCVFDVFGFGNFSFFRDGFRLDFWSDLWSFIIWILVNFL